MEILYGILGVIIGCLLSRKSKMQVLPSVAENPIAAENIYKLDKLLHNIESYDGTEKNQMQINSEEE